LPGRPPEARSRVSTVAASHAVLRHSVWLPAGTYVRTRQRRRYAQPQRCGAVRCGLARKSRQFHRHGSVHCELRRAWSDQSERNTQQARCNARRCNTTGSTASSLCAMQPPRHSVRTELTPAVTSAFVNIASQLALPLGIALRLPSASSTCHHSAEAIEHTAISPSAFRPERPSASPMASAPAGRAEAGAAHEPKPADSEPTPLARAARTPTVPTCEL
jgi:hypothetical protein